jgi:hypothetical protein
MLKQLYALWSLSQKIVKILSTTHHKGTVGVGGEIGLYSFFNLGAKGGRVLNAMPQPLYPGKRPDTHWRGLDGPGWAPGNGLYEFGAQKKTWPHRR